jgi:YD repeat-containing protein
LELGDDIALGKVDGDPDIFYFNFGTYSGSFVFDENRVPRLTSDNDFNITFEQKDENGNTSTTGLISSFTIITDDGTKFIFEDKEDSGVYPGQLYGNAIPESIPNPYGFTLSYTWQLEGWLTYNSSWYLTKIQAADGPQEIYFTYDTLTSFNLSNLSQRSFYGQDETNYHTYRFIDTWCNSLTATHVKKLSRIDWDNGYVTFDANYPRIDTRRCNQCLIVPLPSVTISAALSDINIFNTGQTLIKNYHLSQSNFVSDGASGMPQGEQYGYYRLRLDSITESGTSSSLPPYRFFYDDTVSLPHRLSCEQDFWGHYNGNGASNGQLIPNIYSYPDCDVPNSIYKSIYSVFQRNNSETEYLIQGMNRNSNFNYAKAGILCKIIYPLGGFETFSYDLNTFKVDVNTIEGCGLRISEIRTYDSDTDLNPKIRSFSYNNTNGTTSGIVLNIPEFAYYNYINDPEYDDNDHTIEEQQLYHAVRFSASQTGFGANQSNDVNYQKVTVQNIGNGKTIYEYSFPVQFGVDNVMVEDDLIYVRTLPTSILGEIIDFPFAPDPNYNFMNGKLLSESVFNNTMKIKEIQYVYDIKSFDRIKSYTAKVDKSFFIWGPGTVNAYITTGYSKYYSLSAWAVLSQKTETDFFSSGGSVTKVTDYNYDSPFHKQLTSKITNSSVPNEDIEVTLTYPPDLSGGVYPFMSSMNMISYPIEQTIYNSGKVVVSQLRTFKNLIYHCLPYQVFELETTIPLSTISPYNGSVKDSHYPINPEFEYVTNDINSNPVFIVSKGRNTTYMWGYNYSLPIAKIENMTYEVVSGILANPPFNTTYQQLQTKSSEEIKTIFQNLRGNILMKDAMIYSYTYTPLIGMTSETDPSGSTTIYEYDDFKRLETKKVKDINQLDYILKHIDYHYKNQ